MKTRLVKVLFIPVSIFVVVAALAGMRTYKIYNSYNYFQHVHDPVSDRLMRTCLQKLNHVIDRGNEVLTEPRYSNEQIETWLATSLPVTITFDNRDVEQIILNDENLFTPNGWCHFIDGFLSADGIALTLQHELSVKLVLDGRPTITKSGVEKGLYVWYTETPVRFEYETTDKTAPPPPQSSRKETIITKVSRSASQSNPDGLGISEFITTPRD